jgi:hypothetical protein
MRFDSEVVMGVLQALSQEMASYRQHALQIEEAFGGEAELGSDAATQEMHRALDAITEMTAQLTAYVVPGDGLGEAPESTIELALRARRMTIVVEVGRLRDALRDPASGAPSCGWFAARSDGQFKTMDDVSGFFYAQFHEINCMWMPYRQNDRRSLGIHGAVRRTLYHRAIRVAQRRLCDLRSDPDLAHVLRMGLGASNWPGVHTSFALITAALAFEIEAEPDGQILVHPRDRPRDELVMTTGIPARRRPDDFR